MIMTMISIDEKIKKLDAREIALKEQLDEVVKQRKQLFLKKRESLLTALEKAGCGDLSDEEIVAALTAIRK